MKGLGLATFSSVLSALLLGAPIAAAHQHEARGVDPREDATEAEAPTTSPASELQQVDDEVAFRVSSACRYDARVTGTIQRIDAGAEPLYQPDLVVRTTVTCPNASSTATFDRLGGDRPMTAPQLAREVSKLSAFHRTDGWRSCAYTPGVRLGDEGLAFGDVSLFCHPFHSITI